MIIIMTLTHKAKVKKYEACQRKEPTEESEIGGLKASSFFLREFMKLNGPIR